MPIIHLRRLRWAVRSALAVGVAASVVANVLHALDNPVSQAIAAWPPLALLLTVELISRIPVHRRSLAAVRIAATAVIAGIAAWVSYWHMVGVAARYGETGAAPYLIPLSVDGLIVVASICLVELGGRIAAAGAADTMPDSPADSRDGAGQDKPADTRQDTPPAPDNGPDRTPDNPAPRRPRQRVRSGSPVAVATAARIAAAIAATPSAGQEAVAAAAGVSARTVRRYLAGQQMAAA